MSISGLLSFSERDPQCVLPGKRLPPVSPDVVGPTARCWTTTSGTEATVGWDQSQTVLVYFDGRLDNRGDVESIIHSTAEGSSSNAALVASAYRSIGVNIFEQLIGDWALALFDSVEERLILGVDYPGARTLYYWRNAHVTAWATDLEPLLEYSSRRLSDDYLAQYITRCVTTTPYGDIERLDGGTIVLFSRTSARTRRYYRPRIHDEYRSSTADVLADRFRHLLQQAVADRLRGSSRSAIELSGGLDSSSIACLADIVRRQENADPQRICTVTYTSRDPMFSIDQPYAALVADKLDVDNWLLDNGPLFHFDATPQLTFPLMPFGRRIALDAMCKSRNISSVLSGEGGDLIGWQSGNPYPILADLWKSGSLHSLFRELVAAGKHKQRNMCSLLWHDAIGLTFSVRRPRKLPRPAWLRASPKNGATVLPNSAELLPSVLYFHQLTEMIRQTLAEEWFHLLRPVRACYPFLDRRLIEFAYNVPVSIKETVSTSRALHRLAMKDVLPPAIVGRNSKGVYDGVICRTVANQWATITSLFDNTCYLADAGVVDATLLRRAARLVRDNGRFRFRLTFSRTLALELWIRHLDGRCLMQPRSASRTA